MLANRDLDLDSGVALVPDNLFDEALRGMIARGVAGEAHDDDVAARGLPDRVGRDEHVMANAPVGGRDDSDGARLLEPADYRGVGALHDPGHNTGTALFASVRSGRMLTVSPCIAPAVSRAAMK